MKNLVAVVDISLNQCFREIGQGSPQCTVLCCNPSFTLIFDTFFFLCFSSYTAVVPDIRYECVVLATGLPAPCLRPMFADVLHSAEPMNVECHSGPANPADNPIALCPLRKNPLFISSLIASRTAMSVFMFFPVRWACTACRPDSKARLISARNWESLHCRHP